MTRSAKKGPYVNERLLEKIQEAKNRGIREPIKTWARDSMISPEMVGMNIAVHNGRAHVPIFINESMVGYRLGEFVPTRVFRGHSKRGLTKVTREEE